jgi:hypothetical protein
MRYGDFVKESRGKGKEALKPIVGENVRAFALWCLETRFIITEF